MDEKDETTGLGTSPQGDGDNGGSGTPAPDPNLPQAPEGDESESK